MSPSDQDSPAAGTTPQTAPDTWAQATPAPAQPVPHRAAAQGAGQGGGAAPQQPQQPKLQLLPSRMFASWLSSIGGSLAFTTYQANKLFLIGINPENRRLSIFERSFPRCMGLGVAERGLWISSLHTLWELRDFLDPGQTHQGYDAVYVPLKGHTTGDIDVHDVHMAADGAPIFVATRFNCLARLSPDASFQPVWMPPFIDRIAAEDRCHLNGLAMEDGKPAYVTYVAPSNIAGGWRNQRSDGGALMHVDSGEVVASGFCMPHSPRVRDGKVWMIQSGTGEFGYVDVNEGKFEPVAFMQGFARGVAFAGDHAIVGVSRPRKDRTFEGLALDEKLAAAKVDAQCYLAIVNLNTGDVEHTLGIEGAVQELYDVGFLPGPRRPQALGFKTDEIRFMVRPGQMGTL